MVSPEKFYNALIKSGISFFSGVPDSLLKEFNSYLLQTVEKDHHIIAANEGGAVALAAGHYLANGKPGLVYMQNSGLGNAVNPLVSLAHGKVYQIPMFLLIGWRGEPGKLDEPQHKVQGEITLSILEILNIPYEILPENDDEMMATVSKLYKLAEANNAPVALVVKKEIFDKSSPVDKKKNNYPLSREDALELIIDQIGDGLVISTTGKLSRELFELREKKGGGHHQDFLTVGSMGHASQIALGVALTQPKRKVYCLDGDGAAIMHLGSWAIIGQQNPKNLCHIVFNNGLHDSVGGQPTAGFDVNFSQIAKACNYPQVFSVETANSINSSLEKIRLSNQLAFMEIKINSKSRLDLGRPVSTPVENKKSFMDYIK